MEYPNAMIAKQWAPAGATSVPNSYPNAGRDIERVLALDEIVQAASGTNGTLSDCIMELRGIADSIFGESPTAAQGGGATPYPSGRVHGLGRTVNETRELVNILREQIARLKAL